MRSEYPPSGSRGRGGRIRERQGTGKFDFADRMFASVAEVYHNCTTSDSDLKELVPEFFCCPDFLRNDAARLPLGARQVRIM